jgi:hypothetical protein
MTVPDLHHAWLLRMTGGDPRIGCHADPLWHQPESHYQPKATVRCELIHKHGFGLFLGFAAWREDEIDRAVKILRRVVLAG